MNTEVGTEFGVKRKNGVALVINDIQGSGLYIAYGAGPGVPILTIRENDENGKVLAILSQPQFAQLLPYLQKFAETGKMF